MPSVEGLLSVHCHHSDAWPFAETTIGCVLSIDKGILPDQTSYSWPLK